MTIPAKKTVTAASIPLIAFHLANFLGKSALFKLCVTIPSPTLSVSAVKAFGSDAEAFGFLVGSTKLLFWFSFGEFPGVSGFILIIVAERPTKHQRSGAPGRIRTASFSLGRSYFIH